MPRVLLYLWPALLPLLLFFIWHHWRAQKARKNDEPSPLLKDGPWFMITLLSIIIAIICLFMFGLSQEHTKGDYVPAQMQNNTLNPGKLHP